MLRAEIRAMECFVNAFRYRYFVYSSTNVVVADVLWYISWKMFHSSSFTVHVSLRMAKKMLLIAAALSLGHLKGGAIWEKDTYMCLGTWPIYIVNVGYIVDFYKLEVYQSFNLRYYLTEFKGAVLSGKWSQTSYWFRHFQS